MQRVVVILICLSLSACSNYTFLSKPGWLKNPFSKSTPEMAAPESSPQAGKEIWYCYPDADQDEWGCQNHPASDQINSPAAATNAPASAAQPMAFSSAAVASTPPPPVPELIPRPDPEPGPEAETASAAFARNRQVIMDYPSDHYAVQLIALETLAEVSAYAVAQHIEDPLYARVLTRDQILIVLLLGIYPDRDTAAEAIDQWSTSHELLESPWIRKLDALITAMEGASGDG
jgi:septal ring-binding cell division protein DamX